MHHHPGNMAEFGCVICFEDLNRPSSFEGSDKQKSEANNEVNQACNAAGIDDRRRVIVATPCGHLYHQICLEKWFTERTQICPICQRSLLGSTLLRIYPSNVPVADSNSGSGNAQNLPGPSAGPSPGSSTNASLQQNQDLESGNSNLVAAGPSSSSASVVSGQGPSVASSTTDSSSAASQRSRLGVHDDALSNGICNKIHCQTNRFLHELLLDNFTSLQERFMDLEQNDLVKDTQMYNMQTMLTRKNNEIEELKRIIEQARASTNPTPARKRRRN